MTRADNEIILDERESCTTQEAVAKLIGWMRGKVRRKCIDIDKYGAIVPAQLRYLQALEGTVEHMLDGQWQAARRALHHAEATGTAVEVIERQNAQLAIENLIEDAELYLVEIEVEISKGNSSALKFDFIAEEETGDLHLMIDSLEQWALERCGILIFASSDFDNGSGGRMREEKKYTIREMQERGWLSPVQKESLFATLAFAVDVIAKSKNIFRSKNDDQYVGPIADEIAGVALEMNLKERVAGQSSERVKDRIEEAMKIKKSKLEDITKVRINKRK